MWQFNLPPMNTPSSVQFKSSLKTVILQVVESVYVEQQHSQYLVDLGIWLIQHWYELIRNVPMSVKIHLIVMLCDPVAKFKPHAILASRRCAGDIVTCSVVLKSLCLTPGNSHKLNLVSLCWCLPAPVSTCELICCISLQKHIPELNNEPS